MISADLKHEVSEWIKHDPDPKTAAQLQQWLDKNDFEKIKDSFNGFLEFGTAGLRGPIGPGPSRMNRAVVSRTATGIAAFMKKHGLTSVVIARDARHGSAEFAKDSAEILAGAGFGTVELDESQFEKIQPNMELGDIVVFSTLLVHESGDISNDSIRWSCHFRYTNMFEPDYIERGFPHPYIYKSLA